MNNMKAYIAKIEIEMPIYAQDKYEASKVAADNFKEEIDKCGIYPSMFRVVDMHDCPLGSDLEEFCWSSDPNVTITIKEGIEQCRS